MCERCHGIFDIGAQMGRSPANRTALQRARRLVAKPRNVRVLDDGSDESAATYRAAGTKAPRVVVERRWFTPALFGALLFCVFWDTILVSWYGQALASKASSTMTLAPLLHVAIGVSFTYATLCGFVNRTRIKVESGVLSIAHGPLPWSRNRKLAVENLRQLYCEEIVGRKGSRRYRLNALLTNGEKAPLLTGLTAPGALYLEELLETRLGIPDEAVAGEYV